MTRKDVYERHSTSSCRKERIASWYHHVGVVEGADPYGGLHLATRNEIRLWRVKCAPRVKVDTGM